MNYQLLGVNGTCPEEMVELRGLAELPVAELGSADCTVGITIFDLPDLVLSLASLVVTQVADKGSVSAARIMSSVSVVCPVSSVPSPSTPQLL